MKEIYTSKTSDEDQSSNDDAEENPSENESEGKDEINAEEESGEDNAKENSSEDESEEEEEEIAEDQSKLDDSPASFEELGVSKWILHQLSGLGISRPSPVQANCIAPILAGRDCVGIAKTGQGKTLAFAIPILQTLAVDPYGIYAVILTPTRELAGQIGDSFRSVGKAGMNLREVVVTGGRDTIKQSLDLERRPHVIIATPGRLADHIRTNSTFSLSRVKYLVLDEADRLLEGGFDDDLGTIISALPASRQTLLFTATNSSSISSVIKTCKNDPFIWTAPDLSASSTVDKLDQKYLLTPPEARNSYLTQLLLSKKDENPKTSSIVFCRTCRQAELIGSLLSRVGLKSSTLHSVKPQKERMASLASFKSGHTKILVATDVASRGLDIHAVDLVVNHNVPRDPVDYVHRVGRTARAGRGGEAVSLVTPHDVGLVHAIEAHTGVKWTELELKDERVSEIMVQVNTLYREAEMKLEKEDWGKNREINVRKRKIEQGIDPDVEMKMKQKAKRKHFKKQKKERLKMKTMKSDQKL